jgi:lipid A 3-O-deacylase
MSSTVSLVATHKVKPLLDITKQCTLSRHKRFLLAACVGLCFAASVPVYAQTAQSQKRAASYDIDSARILSLVWENDLFANRDQYYTNGMRIAYLTAEKDAPGPARLIARYLPFSGKAPYRISLAAGQNIYTPTTIRQPVPPTDDRPYAGWLYGSIGLVSDRGNRLDTALLTVGVVGPASLAEQTQKQIHRWTNSPQPLGWDYQLKNEPGAVLTLERKWRSWLRYRPFGLGMDVTPHIGMSLGNIQTNAETGLMVRAGYNLPQDYGPPRIRPSVPGSDFFVPTEKIGGYAFAGLEGRAVARDIFLDGNTFRDGPSVDKEIFVGGLQAGLAATYGRYRLSYTHVLQSREFKTQRNNSQYGAVSLAIRF